MIQKKICMIGAFAVGKTSLVQRFVRSVFSEKYLTTVGVKVDKKIVRVQEQEVMLLVWDIEGDDVYNGVRTSYLRGASGCLLVVDGTRSDTLGRAMKLRNTVKANIGEVPHLLLLNKWDLTELWEIDGEDLNSVSEPGLIIRKTSAKTGDGVEKAFITLAEKMIDRPR